MDLGESETCNEFVLDELSEDDEGSGSSDSSSTEWETDEEPEIERNGEFSQEQSEVNNEELSQEHSGFQEEESSQEVTPSPISRIYRRRPLSIPPITAPPRRRAAPSSTAWQPGTNFTPRAQDFAQSETQFHPDFPLTAGSTPLQILKYFWDEDIVSEICNETNHYCERIKGTNSRALLKCTELTPPEFWKFMGLSTLMGVVKKSVIKDYWSRDELLVTPVFSSVMPRDRYVDILRCLHFVKESAVPPNNTDRFVKFGNVMNHIFGKFSKFVIAGEFLCIDESVMPFKGRLAFKQYVPTKRARFGVKFFVLVDCATKAVLKIIPYQGKGTGLQPQFRQYGIGGSVIGTMLQDGYLLKNHRVVADNWFATPGLVKYLLDNGTYFLGTMQKRRGGDLKPSMTRKLKKGDVESFHKDGILVERWMDRREVCMVNSFMKHEVTDSISSNPNNSRQKPITVLMYNSKMGGVDDVDKVMKPQQSIRKSMKWYKKAFFHLWDHTIYNSFIGYKILHPNSRRRYKAFIEALVREIFQEYPSEPTRLGRPSTVPIVDTRLIGSHFPQQMSSITGTSHKHSCYYCNLTGARSTTSFQCDTCSKWLCVKGHTSCFKKFHTERRLPCSRISS